MKKETLVKWINVWNGKNKIKSASEINKMKKQIKQTINKSMRLKLMKNFSCCYENRSKKNTN